MEDVMELNTEGRQNVDYFTGIEIENTIMKGEPTLFVVGIKDAIEISKMAEREGIRHIYLGTSQCFRPIEAEDWQDWDEFISDLLQYGLWVTLDFDVKYSKDVIQYDWNDCKRFIPMISVKIPNIECFNYYTTLKIDDTTWGHSNPGVWCHPLNELMTTSVFTPWKDYVGDEPVSLE